MIASHHDSDFFTPYTMSVFVSLMEKGMPFTVLPLDLAQEGQLVVNAPGADVGDAQ